MTKVKTLNPKQNYVVVKADEVEQKTVTDSGIQLPDAAQRVEVKRLGTVIEVGPEVDPKKAVVGEYVMFSAYAGTEVEIGGEVFELMLDNKILAGVS